MTVKKIPLIAIILLAVFTNVQAAYLTNVPQKLVQPDGKVFHCFATGDERYSWLHDSNNFTILQDPVSGYYVYARKSGAVLVPSNLIAGVDDPSAAGLQPGLNADPEEIRRITKDRFKSPVLKGATDAKITGTINNIVIFIRFSDQAEYTSSTSAYNSVFNATGTLSMAEYFREVSKAQLAINTTLYPASTGTVASYQDANSRDYYRVYNSITNPIGYKTESERRIREMTLLKDATESVKSQIEATGLDFDNNNDGQVDNVCYIIQGSAEGWNDLLWPHMWSLSAFDVRIGSDRVYTFNFQLSQSFGVSILCHEMSHSLGFPDLYRYENASITPVGSWDIMAKNLNPPQHQSVYTKHKYGKWFSGIPEITVNGNYTLAPLSTDAYAGYKIASPNSANEYFVVEYRKAEGEYESALPGSGLIIYRVNASLQGNADGPPDEVYIFRPNGITTANGEISSAHFSAESGRTTFNATTNPACFLSSGAPGGIEITNIGSAGSTISFTVNLTTPPAILTISPASRTLGSTAGSSTFNVTNTGAGTMNWTAAVTTGASWFRITSGSTGINAGTIEFSTDANNETAERTGVITITSLGATGSPKTVTIIQATNPPVLTASPASRSIDFTSGTASFEVSNAGGGSFDWTAAITAGNSWLQITSGASGTNSGVINISATANPDNAIRTGTITLTAPGVTGSPKVLSIIQAATPPVLTITPPALLVDFEATTTSFEITNTGGGSMAWAAVLDTGAPWLHITSGASGTNTGIMVVTIDTNPDNAIRTGTIIVTAPDALGSPITLTIQQKANPPVLSLSPSVRMVPFQGGITTFDVTNTGGGNMNWTASSEGSSWIHISSGASGTNSGTITIFYDTNPDNAFRSGYLNITAEGATGGQVTVSIEQAANPPILDITPTSRSIGYDTGITSFDVSNTGGGDLVWSATIEPGVSWLHISSGSSGNNAGTITIYADANAEYTSRAGTIYVTDTGTGDSSMSLSVLQEARPLDKPDLIISNLLAILPNVTWPEKIRGSITVDNIGDGPSDATKIHFYLSLSESPDQVRDDLGTLDCDAINNGSRWTKEFELPIEETVTPGDYYLMARVDEPSVNAELNELNNLTSSSISILNTIANLPGELLLSVYPNPASHELHLALEGNSEPVKQVVIADMLGRIVYWDTSEHMVPLMQAIDISSWSKGSYRISVHTSSKIMHKLVIVR
jgi:M6 family metalloprotease-like protein